MTTILTMPRLGETMEEGTIVGWMVALGTPFRRGEPILEIETDKTVAEYPALADGVLVETLVKSGDVVAVGAPIARVRAAEDAIVDAGGDGDRASGPGRVGGSPDRDGGDRGGDGRKRGDRNNPDAPGDETPDPAAGDFADARGGQFADGLDQEAAAAVGSATASEQVTPPPSDATAVAADHPHVGSAGEILAARDRDGRPLRATPIARRIAGRAGIALTDVAGNGRRGRIEARDVQAHLADNARAARPDGTSAVMQTAPGRAQSTPSLSPHAIVRAHGLSAGIAYDRHGRRDAARGTALLLHGFAGDRTAFSAFGAMLGRTGYDVVVPDLPGHGATEVEADGVGELAAPLLAFLRAENIAPAEIVGLSLGSVAAVALAELTPSVRRLTLFAPAGLGLAIDTAYLAAISDAPSPGALRHLLRRLSVSAPAVSDQALAAMAATLAQRRFASLAADAFGPHGQRIDIVEPLERLAKRCAVRVVFGLDDRIIPWQQVSALPSSVAIHLVARAGHMPHWDQPSEILALWVN